MRAEAEPDAKLKFQTYHPVVRHENFAPLDEEVRHDHNRVEGVLVVILPDPLPDADRIIQDQPEHEADPDGQRIACVE